MESRSVLVALSVGLSDFVLLLHLVTVQEGLSEKEWKQNRTFFGFIVKSTLLLKGRLTVVIDPEAKGEDGSDGKVVAAACWLPPGKRLSFGTPVVAVKSGLFKCIKSWGWGGFGVRGFRLASVVLIA